VVSATALPPVRVKGKAEALRVWNITGLRAPAWQGESTKPF
jgi:hypothetical protein